MKTYGVSDKHTGPWLGESTRPDQALAHGRAMYGAGTKLYVAEIAPLSPSSGLPNMAVLVGDGRERLVEEHGIGADSMFDDREVMVALEIYYDEMKDLFDTTITGVNDTEFMIPTKVKIYSPDHQVKVGDFK